MFPQTEKIQFKTRILQIKSATGSSAPWEREESYTNKSFPSSVYFSGVPDQRVAVYWSGPEQKQNKMTTQGVIAMSNGDTNEMLETHKANSYTNRLEHFIGEQIFVIPEVEHIFFSIENDSINVWTIINLLDREVRKRIYDAEYNILNFFRDLSFDFHVVCRNNRNINEIHPSRTKYILHR